MNAFINNKISSSLSEEENSEYLTVVDKIAVAVIGSITVSALLLGSWSGIILLAGRANSGSPLKYFVKLLQLVGLL